MRTQVKIAFGMASLVMCQSQDSIPIIDTTTPTTVPMAEYVPPNDLDQYKLHSWNKLHYPTDYRILDCFQCFEAQGKVCSDEGHNSLFHHTKSSNEGNAFCCKPDSTNDYCQTGKRHDHMGEEHGITTVCSEKSVGATDKFKNILTNGRNHQMFAFCPSINHNKCGVKSENNLSTNMGLKAGLESKFVSSNEMRYMKRSKDNLEGEYDACYYELSLDESLLDRYVPKKIHLQISKKTEMNVYLYGGKSRFEATESIIPGNNQANVMQTYSIGVDKGIMIVAYPNEGVETDFEFEYWLEAVPKSDEEQSDAQIIQKDQVDTVTFVSQPQDEKTQEIDEEEETEPADSGNYIQDMDNKIFYGLCGAAGILLLAIVVVCFKCKNSSQKVKHVNQNSDQNTNSQPSDDGKQDNRNDVQLEVVDMEYDEERTQNSHQQSLSKEAALYDSQLPNLAQTQTKLTKVTY